MAGSTGSPLSRPLSTPAYLDKRQDGLNDAALADLGGVGVEGRVAFGPRDHHLVPGSVLPG